MFTENVKYAGVSSRVEKSKMHLQCLMLGKLIESLPLTHRIICVPDEKGINRHSNGTCSTKRRKWKSFLCKYLCLRLISLSLTLCVESFAFFGGICYVNYANNARASIKQKMKKRKKANEKSIEPIRETNFSLLHKITH